jgi:hypothetical protein
MTLSFFAYWVQEQPSMCGNFSVTAVMREIRKISFRRTFVSRITKVPLEAKRFSNPYFVINLLQLPIFSSLR